MPVINTDFLFVDHPCMPNDLMRKKENKEAKTPARRKRKKFIYNPRQQTLRIKTLPISILFVFLKNSISYPSFKVVIKIFCCLQNVKILINPKFVIKILLKEFG